jgi:hypothetical protein
MTSSLTGRPPGCGRPPASLLGAEPLERPTGHLERAPIAFHLDAVLAFETFRYSPRVPARPASAILGLALGENLAGPVEDLDLRRRQPHAVGFLESDGVPFASLPHEKQIDQDQA